MSKRMGPKYRKGTRASSRAGKATSMQRQKLRAAARTFGTAGNRTARVARAQMNAVTAGFLGIEKKFYDTALAVTAILNPTDATGGELDPSATSMISTPAVGDGEQNRDGKRIVIDSVHVRGTINRPPVENSIDPPVADKVFLALVLDTQSNGAQMNSEDCFKNLSGSVYGAIEPMRNLLFGSRFRVLRSDVFDLDPRTCSAEGDNLHSVGGVTQCFDWFVPLNALPVNFNAGTTSSIANVVDDSLHMIGYSIGGGNCTLTYNARIRFQG